MAIGVNTACAFSVLLATGVMAATCTPPTSVSGQLVRVFPDGSIEMRGGLNVNPDGTSASYTPGDHGFTYIANGLAPWVGGARRECNQALAQRRSGRFLLG